MEFTDDEIADVDEFKEIISEENITIDEEELLSNKNYDHIAVGFFIAKGHTIERACEMALHSDY